MGLTFRNVKGSALTIDELDDNFSYFTGSQSITGSLIVTGDEDVNGNLIVSGNITGTSSLAVTASHAITASHALTTPIAPTQTSVTASGTDITTTVVLEYGKVNLVYCDNSDYAVRLPEPIFGGEVKVVNQGVADLSVFPYDTDDSIVGLTTGSAYTLYSGSLMYTFECVQNPSVGVWSVAIPTSQNSVKRTFTQDITVSSVSGVTNPDGSKSGEQNLGGSISNFGGINMAVPSNSNYIDSVEWGIYNRVRINKIEVLSNVRAGDLTNSASQISSTLMGLTANEFAGLRLSAVSLLFDGVNTINNLLWDWRFDQFFSMNHVNGTPAYNTEYYLPTPSSPAPMDGNLYQKVVSVYPNGWQTGWNDINDANGNRKFFTGLNALVGNSNFPFSSYPAGFELKLQYNIEFEFTL